MMTIQILGPGCPKCRQLAANVRQAADQLGREYQLLKITDLNEIMNFGVMVTPALAINGEVKVVGTVPSDEQIRKLLA